MTEPTTALATTAATTTTGIDDLALLTFDAAAYAAAVFQPYHDRLDDALVANLTLQIDIGTPAGMAIAIEQRAFFRDDIRIDGDKTRAERKAPLLAIERAIDAGYKQLAALARPYEEAYDLMIKTENSRKESERTAKIAAERARVEAIERDIRALADITLGVAGKPSAIIRAGIELLEEVDISAARFAELVPAAALAIGAAIDKMVAMYTSALAGEQAAAAREEARQAETRRVEAMAAENARQQAENARKGAELAALAAKLGVVMTPDAPPPPPAYTTPAVRVAAKPAADAGPNPTDQQMLDNYIDKFGGTLAQAKARHAIMKLF